MPSPKEHERNPQGSDNARIISVMCDQLVADIPSLPAEAQQVLAQLCGAELPCAEPVKAVADHLKDNPTRIRKLALVYFEQAPFRDCYAFFSVIRPTFVSPVLFQRFVDVFGPARWALCVAGLDERTKTKGLTFSHEFVNDLVSSGVSPSLDSARWEPLAAEFRAQTVLLDEALKSDLAVRLDGAEKRYAKAEADLIAEKASRKTQEEKLAKQHQRGKQTAKEEAEAAAAKKFKAQLAEKDAEIARLSTQIAGVQAALDEARKAVPQPGVSPAEIDALRARMEKEYADRLETELFLRIGPWLDRLQAAEDGYKKTQEAVRLSSQVLEQARKEAMEKDLLLHWESEPENALPKIENALAEVDRLLALTASPTPGLLQMHRHLRGAIDGCRALIAERKGVSKGSLMTNAILAGIKAADYDQLIVIAQSVNILAGTKVLTDDEATAVARLINDETKLRKAREEHKTSTFSLLHGDLRGGQEVDILVDAYNFMHLAKQHFAKLERPVPGDSMKTTFDREGRAKLALMASRIPAKFKQARVLLFLDGQNCEKPRPHDGVQFKVPTIQKTGEGQADAEIIHYLSHGVRPKASIYVVSNDHQVRDTANRHLSVGLFAKLLDELS